MKKFDKPIFRLNEIDKSLLDSIRQTHKSIVASNGCFDVLHIGHSRNLAASKSLGDFLVIGLNSDSSVKTLKGNNRPINSELDRAELLSMLKPVDMVVIFEEQDACNFLKKIKPDIYTKGGDYSPQEIKSWPEYQVAQDLGCKIKLIDLVEERSSTKIINKLDPH